MPRSSGGVRKAKARDEIPSRLEALFERLERLGLDGAILDRRDDAYYFSGYTGSDAVVLLSVKKRRGWLVTDSRYAEEAEQTAPGLETVLWRGGFAASVGKMIGKFRLAKMAYTPSTLRVAFFDHMRREAGTRRWRDIDSEIGDLRSVKSPGEVDAIAKAVACADAAFLAAKKRWRAGMTEIEVKNDLEWEMRRRGAEDASFETIVAVGPNASLPHAHAGNGKIRPGAMLLVDFGARLGRYNSDCTRTLWAGSVPAVWLKRYRKVLAAQAAGLAAIRAGVPCSAPDAAAREVLAGAGLEEKFTHGLGHGVGLAVHEEPRLGKASRRVLAAGNVVTVEPGVYFPGSGGIRIEDMAVVEEEGARVLGMLPKDPESLVF